MTESAKGVKLALRQPGWLLEDLWYGGMNNVVVIEEENTQYQKVLRSVSWQMSGMSLFVHFGL